jgi:hypothetical protein
MGISDRVRCIAAVFMVWAVRWVRDHFNEDSHVRKRMTLATARTLGTSSVVAVVDGSPFVNRNLGNLTPGDSVRSTHPVFDSLQARAPASARTRSRANTAFDPEAIRSTPSAASRWPPFLWGGPIAAQ